MRHDMTRSFRIAALTALLAINAAGSAQADDSSFQAFGGQPGLTRMVDDFVNTVVADPRIGSYFTRANLPNLKSKLTEQFCSLLGGPCQYVGQDMTAAHQGMGLKEADFNALAEDLQFAMNRAGIPFATQNVLVAKLAPMSKAMLYR
jgi:hemoglobin